MRTTPLTAQELADILALAERGKNDLDATLEDPHTHKVYDAEGLAELDALQERAPFALAAIEAVQQARDEAVQFFYDYAGWSWAPGHESEDEGRRRCARELAEAEAWAHANDSAFEWEHDPDEDSSSFADGEPYPLWVCHMLDDTRAVLQSLAAIDLGEHGHPDSDPYARVVQAELAEQQRHAMP